MNLLDVVLPTARNHNAQIRVVNNHVFTYGGEDFFLRYAEKKSGQWVKVSVGLLGDKHEVYVSLSMVNTLLAAHALTLEGMSADAVTLWLLMQAPSMPKGLQIQGLEIVEDAELDWVFEAHSYANSQSLGWQVGGNVSADALQAIVKVLMPYCKGVMASPLATLPIPVPLIGCAIPFPASEIALLEVGDVILLEEV